MANKTISASNSVWTGTKSADKFYINEAYSVRVNTGAGNDSIYNDFGFYGTINASKGNDTIINYSGVGSSLNGGAGADLVSLSGGFSDVVTVIGGTGNDTIYGSGNKTLHRYAAGDGFDVIYNWSENDTLTITGGTYTRSTVKNDVVVKVGKGAITLKNAKGKTININPSAKTKGLKISNSKSNRTLSGSTGNDTIANEGSKVTINSGKGKDSISNYGDSVKIYAGADNDSIWSWFGTHTNITISGGDGNDRMELWGKKSSLLGGNGNDTIFIHGKNVTTQGGSGNDYIENWDDNVGRSDDGDGKARIYASAGNDTIKNFGSGARINAGTGDDVIRFSSHNNGGVIYSSKRNVIQYALGGGDDTVYNFGATDTLSVSGSAYTRSTVGSDVVVKVGEGSITFKNAAGNTINIDGTLKSGNDFSIPSDALTYNGHSYYLYTNVASTWEDAKAYCEARGGYLAVINNSAENSALFNYMKNKGYDSAYFGFSDAEQEGTWKWVTDEQVSYINWGDDDEPNGGTYENYGMFYYKYTNGEWNDGDFSDIYTIDGRRAFICEWDTVTTGGKTITNYSKNSLVSGTAYADTITNYAGGVTVQSGAGNDSIYNSTTSNYTINSGYGYVTIDGGDGNDTISNLDPYVSINGGAGNDKISLSSYSHITVKGGTGNDTIYGSTSSGHLYQYASGDGNDTIYYFGAQDTLSISGGQYTRLTVDNDVIIKVGEETITLKDAKGKTIYIDGVESIKSDPTPVITLRPDPTPTVTADHTVTGTSGNDNLSNSVSSAVIYGYAGNDTIKNSSKNLTLNNVTMFGGDGKDYIYNKPYYSYDSPFFDILIDGGANNDYIENRARNATLIGGEGHDTITSTGNEVSITGNAGNDSIDSSGEDTAIYGGDGVDKIHSKGNNSYIDGGTGNDSLRSDPNNNSYTTVSGGINVTMNGGNGNDYIYCWLNDNGSLKGGNGSDTIRVAGGDYVTVNGGAGNDSIIFASARTEYNVYNNPSVFIEYSSGDGDDTITGFDDNDTLSIAGSYTRSTLDKDVIFSFDSGSITLKDAKGVSINIDSTPLSSLIVVDGYNSEISDLNLLSNSNYLAPENNLLAYSGEK